MVSLDMRQAKKQASKKLKSKVRVTSGVVISVEEPEATLEVAETLAEEPEAISEVEAAISEVVQVETLEAVEVVVILVEVEVETSNPLLNLMNRV